MKTRLFLQSLFTILRFLSDIICIFTAFVLAYIVKFKTKNYPHAQIEPYIAVLPYVILLWLIAFVLAGLYRPPKGLLARLNEATLIFSGVTFGTLEVMAFSFAYPDFPASRFVLGYTFIFSIIFLLITRLVIHSLELWFLKRGLGNRYAAVVGSDTFSQTIGEKMLMYPTLGYHLVGFIADNTPEKINYHLKNDKFKLLGTIDDIQKIVKDKKIDSIFIGKTHLPEIKMLEIASFCDINRIELKIIPSMFEMLATSLDVNTIDGIPLLSFKKRQFSKPKKIVKRLLDIFISLILIIFTSPLMLITAAAVKISSPNGPVIYTQRRVGENGKEFNFLKFRTMPINAESQSGPVWATDDQKKRTIGVGNFLRKTSLDELPQLINVLRGDMSLVGPRPERPFFVEKLSKTIPNFKDRLLVKGGITGWAQINGRAYLTAKPEEKLKYDIYYIENWSPLFDLKIMLKTISDVLFQKNTV